MISTYSSSQSSEKLCLPFNYFEFKVEVVPVHWGVRSSYCGRGMSMQSLLKGTKRHIEVESLVPGGSILNTKIKEQQNNSNKDQIDSSNEIVFHLKSVAV